MTIEARGDEKLESPQVGTWRVLRAGLICLLLIPLAIGMLGAVYYRRVPEQTLPAPGQFPQPRVQTGQREQLHRLEAEQTARLRGYHWVDRNTGVVQIPIERAMQILAAEGAQGWAPLAPPQALFSPSAGAQRLITPQAVPPAAPGPGAGSNKPSTAGSARDGSAVADPQQAAGASTTAPEERR